MECIQLYTLYGIQYLQMYNKNIYTVNRTNVFALNETVIKIILTC